MELYQPNVELYNCKSAAEREAKYRESVENPDKFWGDYARENFHWEAAFTQVRDINMDSREGPISIKWFINGKPNLCYNCLDRHILSGKGDRAAYYFEGNEVSEESKITYNELHSEVQKFSNVLLKHGVTKGTRVTVYMPMIIALPVVILACARIGAVLNVVFAGFSAHALSQRIADCTSDIIVTADSVYRGAKAINLKEIVDHAIEFAAKGTVVKKCIVYERHGRKVEMKEGRDVWYQDEMKDAVAEAKIEWLDSEDPCFLLYTSGSTGKPKGVLHTTAGYMVYTSITFLYSFDYHESDIYWCTADIGWITGHSYIVFGPLLNAATSVLFEGVPTHPDAGRCWAVVDKYQVTIFYTAPTAIRALQKFGNDIVQKYSRKSPCGF